MNATSTFTVVEYEGGIAGAPLTVTVSTAALAAMLRDCSCSCGGECHDECAPCEQQGPHGVPGVERDADGCVVGWFVACERCDNAWDVTP